MPLPDPAAPRPRPSLPRRLRSIVDRLWAAADAPIRNLAHDSHEQKELWFRWFFVRTPLGRWITRNTTANQWSISRFPLAGILLATLLGHHRLAIFTVIFLIGLTDLIDGALARQQGTASPQGTRLESLADSVCLWTMFIAMFFLTGNLVLRWLFGLAGCLEVIRLGAVAYYEKRVDLKALSPNQSGKYKTVFYIAGALAWVVRLTSVTTIFLTIGIFLSVLSLRRHHTELESLLRSQR